MRLPVKYPLSTAKNRGQFHSGRIQPQRTCVGILALTEGGACPPTAAWGIRQGHTRECTVASPLGGISAAHGEAAGLDRSEIQGAGVEAAGPPVLRLPCCP